MSARQFSEARGNAKNTYSTTATFDGRAGVEVASAAATALSVNAIVTVYIIAACQGRNTALHDYQPHCRGMDIS